MKRGGGNPFGSVSRFFAARLLVVGPAVFGALKSIPTAKLPWREPGVRPVAGLRSATLSWRELDTLAPVAGTVPGLDLAGLP